MSRMKEAFVGMSESTSKNNNKKKLSLLAFFGGATLLLVAAVVGVVSSRKNYSSPISHGHAIIKSACSSTLYPELCFSSITSEPAAVTQKVSSHRDVIRLALNITSRIVERNYFTIRKLLLLSKSKGLTLSKRQKTALHDCLETIDETLHDLGKARDNLQHYPSKKSLYRYAGDLKTLISSAITNQVTCLDGFSHQAAEKRFRKRYVEGGQVHVEHLCSNALAMTINLTQSDIANYEQKVGTNKNRKLMEEELEVLAGLFTY